MNSPLALAMGRIQYKGVHGEHDVLYAGPSPEVLSDEDLSKVIELGWLPDSENGCFYIFT